MGEDTAVSIDIRRFIEAQEWRYAVKNFDANKKVDKEALQQLMRATQLSASSFGLQAYKILIVEDPHIKGRLRGASWGQRQVMDCSHLFVFCIPKVLQETHVDHYVENVSTVRGVPIENLDKLSNYIKSFAAQKNQEEQAAWLTNQAYIALGSLLNACALMEIDACPMEGFEPSKYDYILGLEAQNLQAVVVVAVGYRSEEDENAAQKKVRKPEQELFEWI